MIRRNRYPSVSALSITIACLVGLAILPRNVQAESRRRASRRSAKTYQDIWLVNTRKLARPVGQRHWNGCPVVWRFRNGAYKSATLDELIASHDPSQQTCIYIHGNQQTTDDASGQGLVMHEKLLPRDHRCRFIVWSWPSEKINNPVRDARAKAYRADGEAFFLASFLATLPPQTDVAMVGYSYGARATSGSLHLLAGGQLGSNCLPPAEEPRVQPRVVLLAAAFPRFWLNPNQVHGLTLHQARQTVSFYNRLDPILGHFDLVHPGHPQALGNTGIAPHLLGSYQDRLCQFDATRIAGRSHSLYRFTDSEPIIKLIQRIAIE